MSINKIERPIITPFAGIKKDYFSTVGNTIITIVSVALLAYLVWSIFDWAYLRAVFAADGVEACKADDAGACWSVITVRWRIIFFGLYPYEEHWRSALACLAILLTTIISCVPRFWTGKKLTFIWVIGYACFYILMQGGIFGLTHVGINQWGGLSLTVYVFASVALIGMPMAIGLALMRRSELRLVRQTTALIIDVVRSLPLLTILFTAAIVFPFVLPDWLQGDKLYRVVLGYALFFACYQAEIIRGGMQAVPAGQEEAAKSLGMGYWKRVSHIVLPQAFRAALPPTINQFVITFMETSLIVIIGFFEVVASGAAAFGASPWSFAYIEVYVFVGLIFFLFVFSLSRYGAFLESRLSVAQR